MDETTLKDGKNLVSVSKEGRNVIAGLIRADPSERLTLAEVESHPVFSSLRPQAFNLTAKMDELNFPICKLSLFNFDPDHKNFITCLAIKHAETGQRI